jgi:hypothetical protein
MNSNSRHSASVMRRPLGTSFATSLVKMTCLWVVKYSPRCQKMTYKKLTDIRIDRRCIYRCSKFAWASLCAIRLITDSPVLSCPFERMTTGAVCWRISAARGCWMRRIRARPAFKPCPRPHDKRHFSVAGLPLKSYCGNMSFVTGDTERFVFFSLLWSCGI